MSPRPGKPIGPHTHKKYASRGDVPFSYNEQCDNTHAHQELCDDSFSLWRVRFVTDWVCCSGTECAPKPLTETDKQWAEEHSYNLFADSYEDWLEAFVATGSDYAQKRMESHVEALTE